MEAFETLSGKAVPLDIINVDTDQIIPKQFLKKIDRAGFGVHLFHDWRYLDDAGTDQNPEFVLNFQRYQGSKILLTREKFGCGSSREHAPWALHDYGFRCIIASSFADIFYNNCFQNGILPIKLSKEKVKNLIRKSEKNNDFILNIDLESQRIWDTEEEISEYFEIEKFRKHCLQNGLDDIGLTLEKEKEIKIFESNRSNIGGIIKNN